MYTYTTPTVTCTLKGAELSQVDYVRVAFKGKVNRIVIKTVNIDDIDKLTGNMSIKLTQQETARLGEGKIEIQARVHYADGTVQSTDKVYVDMHDVIDKVVI